MVVLSKILKILIYVVQADAIAQQEFASKYPGKKPSTFAQRKISNKGVSMFTLYCRTCFEY